jgi:hypothetical protein
LNGSLSLYAKLRWDWRPSGHSVRDAMLLLCFSLRSFHGRPKRNNVYLADCAIFEVRILMPSTHHRNGCQICDGTCQNSVDIPPPEIPPACQSAQPFDCRNVDGWLTKIWRGDHGTDCLITSVESFHWESAGITMSQNVITAFKALLDLPSGKVPIQSWTDHISLVTYTISV